MAQTTIKDTHDGAMKGQIGAVLWEGLKFSAVVASGKSVTPGQPVIVSSVTGDGTLVVRAIENSDTIDETKALGFVALDTLRENENNTGYSAGRTVTVIRKGIMYVQTSAAVAAMAPVYVGNLTAQLGNIDDEAGTGMVQYPGAQFLTATSAAGIAKILIDTRTSQPDETGA